MCLVNYFVQNSGGLKNVLIFLAADNIHRAPRGKFKTRNLVYGGVVFYMKYIFFLESGRRSTIIFFSHAREYDPLLIYCLVDWSVGHKEGWVYSIFHVGSGCN